ncbi:insulin-like growth factor 2 mRNA-binding protein 1 [Encephalitozoon intestinalis]|nr:insulin-like growth factor 2 mRNA-binding protein 1 [Encephalitozoon intestinalis]
MKWDVDKEYSTNEPQEEVKRVKRAIEGMDVKPMESGRVSLTAEENGVEGHDLNFKRQVKKKVNDYKYKTLYNVGKTKNPYALTRNSVVIAMEEELGVEILVKGSYKPEELNGDTDDSDGLVYEISAPTPEILQEAMFKIPSMVKTVPVLPWTSSSILGRYVWKNGTRYHSYRIFVDPDDLSGKMNEFRKDIEAVAADKSVDIAIRGKFSGHVEPCFGEEANEPPYIQILTKTKKEIREVRKACREVISKHSEISG